MSTRRKIVERNIRGKFVRLTLECSHEMTLYVSQAPQSAAVCRLCTPSLPKAAPEPGTDGRFERWFDTPDPHLYSCRVVIGASDDIYITDQHSRGVHIQRNQLNALISALEAARDRINRGKV